MKNIRIFGARQNNLKDFDIEIPRNQIVVFTGVSGSGKSSLVFETINAEAQRQLYDTFGTFVQGKLPKVSKPECDLIENISPSIVIKQKRSRGSSRSTVGTATEIYTFLRLLFSRVGTPFIGASTCFSFNSIEGMCPDCNGSGHILKIDMQKIIDMSKSLNDGAILFPDFKVGSWQWKYLALSGFFDPDLPVNEYSDKLKNKFFYGKEANINIGSKERELIVQYEGLVTKINRLYVHKNQESLSKKKKDIINKFLSIADCQSCKGSRLNHKALSVLINGQNINDVTHFQIDRLSDFINNINDPRAKTITAQIQRKTQYLIDIGLGYLSLSRKISTLSGGEAQRIKLAKQLGSSLTEMLYILDEPSVGLHPRDVDQLNNLLKTLRDKGNSVLVVEHDPDVIKIADHIIDVGPKAGVSGGNIVFQGSYQDILTSSCLTGNMLSRSISINRNPKKASNFFEIKGAKANNLKDIDIKIPKGIFTCVTGVAGSGKSSLIHHEFLKHHPSAIIVDQSPVGQSERSNAATYTGLFDDIRKLFSEVTDINSSMFSFNSNGACDTCRGLGFIETEMAFLDPIRVICEVCEGSRYKPFVLKQTYNEKNIADVLKLTVDEALNFFELPHIIKKLNLIKKVGLGYLSLGQPLSTLSGGECQRIKLSSELHKSGQIYVLDEPTTGLHMADSGRIINIIRALADHNNTVIVVEHNLDVIAQADWVIDVGPEGGIKGGEITFEGSVTELLEKENNHTAKYLIQHINSNK